MSTICWQFLVISQVIGATDSQSQGGAVQIPPAFKNFSMSQKEKTLDQLVKDHWLCSTPEGKIGIGIRSFLDLRSWFRSNEVPACEVCNEAAIKVPWLHGLFLHLCFIVIMLSFTKNQVFFWFLFLHKVLVYTCLYRCHSLYYFETYSSFVNKHHESPFLLFVKAVSLWYINTSPTSLQ